MSTTSIEWTDVTWNPVQGCSRVSPGCQNCYAERMMARFDSELAVNTPGGPRWTGKVRLREDRLDQPLRWRKPRRVFVNSVSDLFHEDVPVEFIARVWSVMAQTPHHTFQVLTKRPERMAQALSSSFDADAPLPNVWLGVTCENQEQADKRIPHLLQTPAAVRFLSVEPMLGPVDVMPYLSNREDWYCPTCDRFVGGASVKFDETHDLCGQPCGDPPLDIHWVICGGESGPGARPIHPDWARSLRDQCAAAGVPFFFKQWGGVNKKSAGRELDGRTHDELPGMEG